ncbi:MAG: hypothetical protein U9N14_02025 [Pseudomonadota bacterium]|nr:hypothetical protein [Pseudomonadota bacterium]
MAEKLIQNHDRFDRVLAFDTASFAIREIDRPETLTEEDCAHGFYVKSENRFLILLAGKNGPDLIVGETLFHLTDPDISLTISAARNRRRFTVLRKGEALIAFDIGQVKNAGADSWATEEMNDMFSWLVSMSESQDFHRFYQDSGSLPIK